MAGLTSEQLTDIFLRSLDERWDKIKSHLEAAENGEILKENAEELKEIQKQFSEIDIHVSAFIHCASMALIDAISENNARIEGHPHR